MNSNDKINAKNILGKTELRIPPIIFGTSCLGNLYEAIDFSGKLSIMSEWFRWVDSPVVIDTAGKYGAGLALEVIGKGLSELGIDKQDIVISNKLGWLRTPLKGSEPTFEPGVWANLEYDAKQKISYKGIIECYRQGLELLGGNYGTQIVSVHDPDEYLAAAQSKAERESRMNDIIEAYHALKELKDRGEVEAVGVGAKDWKIIKLLTDQIDMDWVMLALSLTIINHPPEILDYIDELNHKGVGIINSALFHGGFLTGGDFFDYRRVERSDPDDRRLFEWRDRFFDLCSEYNVKPAAVCVAFGQTPPGVCSIALNTSKAYRVRANTELIKAQIPGEFWVKMISDGLIDSSYSFL